MVSVDFPGRNIIVGKDQPEYLPLYGLVIPNEYVEIITCFEMSEEEFQEFAKTRRLYLSQWTFGNKYQPMRPMIDLSDGIDIKYEDPT